MHTTENGLHVLLSTLGRSHYVIAAEYLVKHGVDISLLQGWVPKRFDSIWIKIAAFIIRRRSFVPGLKKRLPPALEGHVVSSVWGELVQTMLFLTVGRISKCFYHLSATIAFYIHGFFSRQFFTPRGKRLTVFHVKSGLGRGGAIAEARRRGMKILVDHCVPHPLSMKKTTGENGYDEWWSFWKPVMKDCNEADLVMVGSEYVKKTFVEFGFPSDKIRVVPLGVLPLFSRVKTKYAKEGCLELIYTGNWGHWKGVDDLIDSVEIMKNRGLDIHLTVVGSHDEKSPSYNKAVNERLPVTFVGHVPQEELKGYLELAEVYVFPSLRDGFAVSAFEGMAAGLCLVTTEESSIPITDGITGYYVSSHAPKAIADRIEYLFNNRREIERIGRAAADKVASDYTWERYAENVQKVYRELLDEVVE